jgi:hypothetical protein
LPVASQDALSVAEERAAAVEARQAEQLAAVQETMRELGDDMLSAFELPEVGSGGGAGQEWSSLAAAEAEVRAVCSLA